MIKTLLLLIALTPQVGDKETAWSGWIAEQLDATAEARFNDHDGAGRVDVLTKRHAIEVEWAKAPKAPESLTQASRYGEAFELEPVVIFLTGRGNDVAERAIAATTAQFGKQLDPPVRVLWIDVRDPDVERLKRQLYGDEPTGQE